MRCAVVDQLALTSVPLRWVALCLLRTRTMVIDGDGQGNRQHWNRVPHSSTPHNRSTPRSPLSSFFSSHLRSHTHRRPILSRLLVLTVATVAVGAVLLSGLATPMFDRASAVSADSASSTDHPAMADGLNPLDIAYFPKLARERADAQAAATLKAAQALVAAAPAKVNTTAVTVQIASLSNYTTLDVGTVNALTKETNAALARTAPAVASANRAIAAARAAAAETLRVANTVSGAQATARSIAASQYGWGDGEFQCLSSLWQKESGWSYAANNSGSGAAGIPQALPGSKMSSFGADWATNATTQIRWGLDYIARAYGTPCAAWGHSGSYNWY